MSFWSKLVVCLAVSVLVAGCQEPETKQVDGGVLVGGSGGSASLQRVNVDGVWCIALTGYQKGALSCDWGY